jgi:hypothetical protein
MVPGPMGECGSEAVNEPVYQVKETPVAGVLELGILPPVWNQNWTSRDGLRFQGPGSDGDPRILSLLCWLGWQWRGRHWRESQRDDSSQRWHVDGDEAVLIMLACVDPTQRTEFCARPRGLQQRYENACSVLLGC